VIFVLVYAAKICEAIICEKGRLVEANTAGDMQANLVIVTALRYGCTVLSIVKHIMTYSLFYTRRLSCRII